MDKLALEKRFMERLESLSSADLLNQLESSEPSGLGDIVDEYQIYSWLKRQYFTTAIMTCHKYDVSNAIKYKFVGKFKPSQQVASDDAALLAA